MILQSRRGILGSGLGPTPGCLEGGVGVGEHASKLEKFILSADQRENPLI